MVPRNSGTGTALLRNAKALLRWFLGGTGPLRTGMIRAARRAPGLLGESTALVRDFVLGKQNTDGGFQDRAGRSDLYYSVFGMQTALALGVPLPLDRLGSYLDAFGIGENLDFVHLCCLARCRALLSDMGAPKKAPGLAGALTAKIERYRSRDGGYHSTPGSAHGSAAAAFLALGAYEDLQRKLPEAAHLKNALRLLATPEGGWANEAGAQNASTHSTAAAMAVLGSLGNRADYAKAARWLLAQAHPLGGFRAWPLAPAPDLLSTAIALHAITSAGFSCEPVREFCLDFIDTLWTNAGGFHGHWHDDFVDLEYTFYGLLALGHLSR